MIKTVCFVTSAYNNSTHLEDCYESLREQTNPNWDWVILNDMSSDDTFDIAKKIVMRDERERVTLINHDSKKYPLKGIYDYVNSYNDFSEQIIAILNGDDALCNENTVELLLKEYNNNSELDALWTSHSWDINGMNTSKEIPRSINPYQYPWVSSHLKTFKVHTFKKINKENFQDLCGNWFKFGCDQALYIPILYTARDRKFLDEICYLYRLNTKLLENKVLTDHETHSTIKLVRARGYLN